MRFWKGRSTLSCRHGHYDFILHNTNTNAGYGFPSSPRPPSGKPRRRATGPRAQPLHPAVKHYEAFNKLGPSAPLRPWLTNSRSWCNTRSTYRTSRRVLEDCSAPRCANIASYPSCRSSLVGELGEWRLYIDIPRIQAVSPHERNVLGSMHEHRVAQQGSRNASEQAEDRLRCQPHLVGELRFATTRCSAMRFRPTCWGLDSLPPNANLVDVGVR